MGNKNGHKSTKLFTRIDLTMKFDSHPVDRVLSEVFYRSARDRGAKCLLDEMDCSLQQGMRYARGDSYWPARYVRPLFEATGDIVTVRATVASPGIAIVPYFSPLSPMARGTRMTAIDLIRVANSLLQLAAKQETGGTLTAEESAQVGEDTQHGHALLEHLLRELTEVARPITKTSTDGNTNNSNTNAT